MSFIIRSLSALGLLAPLRSVAESLLSLTPARAKQERDMHRFYARFVKAGEVVFDIGANVGNRTAVFRTLGASVIAVDPQPSCVARLRKRFGSDPKVTVVPTALGEQEGEAELLVSNASTISSLSPEWVNAVRKSGRFSAYRWNRSVTVPLTTLDRIIERYGVPVFVKIDVEGFELPVLKGLSQPVGGVSFEFVPEFIDAAVQCVWHLDSIGMPRFNYSVGESMGLALSEWVTAEEISEILISFPDSTTWGDVYGRKNPGARRQNER